MNRKNRFGDWRGTLAAFWIAALCAAAGTGEGPKAGDSEPASRPEGDLSRKLLNEKEPREDPIERMMALMDESARRLSENQDAGPRTQLAQKMILDAIDDALRGETDDGKNSQGGSKKQTTDKRGSGKRQTSKTRSGSRGAEPTPGQQGQGRPPTDDAPVSRPLADRPELRRGWGYLPARDREAIIQGAGDDFPARYREQIEEYYRAIAEAAEKQR